MPVDTVPPPNVCAASDAAIADAAHLIRAGELVAFPTETVYGLGADATNGEAVARIFEAKGRPRFNPLIVHVPSLAAAEQLGIFSARARTLADAFWPGALTIVVPRQAGCQASALVSAGLDTIALRCPDHPVARALLRASGRPIAAPSANRSGHVSATTAEHVAADLGSKAAMILDAGPTVRGIESTVVGITGDQATLLRPGALPAAEAETVIGVPLIRRNEAVGNLSAPGQLESHYAPRARLRLGATDCTAGEALLAFGGNVPSGATMVVNLSPRGNMIEAAANLFAALRQLDASGATSIAVVPIPEDGLGEAINDRLRRAAAPRTPSNGTAPTSVE